ncbi:hypothetical protein F5Y18DRAFT_195536 [Xylariaceae sp. FL1019]|nr:hypothetical protein F5Y18DRAFT_195536 [Xylariaceae sp. FL1019]
MTPNVIFRTGEALISRAPSAEDVEWFGWRSSPDSRGTLDIVWSCLLALNLCLYTMLHLNVPAPSDKFLTICWRKLRWACLGLLAPELPMLFACGQWASAVRSVHRMHDLGYPQWSLEHGFFADMGGFVVHPLDAPAMPISALQLHYLVKHGFIQFPLISRAEIRDKSKADSISKVFTGVQTGWLVVQVIGRAIQRIDISPLEFATICICGCSYCTLWFWRRKPLDVAVPVPIAMNHTVAKVMRHAGHDGTKTFTDTPLDFIEPEAYMSRKWSRHVHGWIEAAGLQSTPIQRIPDDRDPQPSNLRTHVWLGIGTASFASIHFAAWNFQFPSDWERDLWRYNCCVMWGLLAVYGTAEVVVCWKEGYRNLGLDTLGAYKRRFPDCLWFFVPAALYIATRLIIIFESLWSLRQLPSGVFQTVEWAEFIPHI